MSPDHACKRCRRSNVEGLVDIASTPMRRIVADDPLPETDLAEAVLVCEECVEDFGARSRPVHPTEFVAARDRTTG